jgi:hypothetical protein
MKKYSVDRIENGIAVCESDSGEQIKLLISELPDVHEGDILTEDGGKYKICADETAERRKKIAELQRNIFKK